MPPDKKKYTESIRAVSQIGSFALTMGAAILLGYYIGSRIDRKFGTEPCFMIVFMLLFIAGAFIKFIQSINEFNNKEK